VFFGAGLSVACGISDLLRRSSAWSTVVRVSAVILLCAILLPSISDADEIAAFSYLGAPSRSAGQNGSASSESSPEDAEEQFAGFWQVLEHQDLVRLWSQLTVAILWFLSIAGIRKSVSFLRAASSPDRAPPTCACITF